LLVAGTTGSGKSVAVKRNDHQHSLLRHAGRSALHHGGPKQLELSIYEGIPHLLLPVVVGFQKASLALRWAVDEMERRYELLSKSGVRDISSYNAKIEAAASAKAVAARWPSRPPNGASDLSCSSRAKMVWSARLRWIGQRTCAMAAAGDGTISEERAEEISAAAATAQAAKETRRSPGAQAALIVIVIDDLRIS